MSTYYNRLPVVMLQEVMPEKAASVKGAAFLRPGISAAASECAKSASASSLRIFLACTSDLWYLEPADIT